MCLTAHQTTTILLQRTFNHKLPIKRLTTHKQPYTSFGHWRHHNVYPKTVRPDDSKWTSHPLSHCTLTMFYPLPCRLLAEMTIPSKKLSTSFSIFSGQERLWRRHFGSKPWFQPSQRRHWQHKPTWLQYSKIVKKYLMSISLNDIKHIDLKHTFFSSLRGVNFVVFVS